MPLATGAARGEEYLDLAKRLQAKQPQAMREIVKGLTVTDQEEACPSTEHLAELQPPDQITQPPPEDRHLDRNSNASFPGMMHPL